MNSSVVSTGNLRLGWLLLLVLSSLCSQSNLNAQLLDTSSDRVLQTIEQSKLKKPCQLSARIHLQEGSTKGYLVVKAKLLQDHYIYSLTQPGGSASAITVKADQRVKLMGKFMPDTPAKVIAKDPLLGHAVEKHFKQVQFFVPIEIAPQTDLNQLAVNLRFDGQVCGDESCMPLSEKLVGKFSGYFKAKKGASSNGVANSKKTSQWTPPNRSANQRQPIRK